MNMSLSKPRTSGNAFTACRRQSATHSVKRESTATPQLVEPIAALQLVALAAYRPLHSLEGAASLLSRSWPPSVASLLKQQVQDPQQEIALRGTLPALTPVEDRTDEAEPHGPSPLWVKATTTLQPRAVQDVVQGYLPYADAMSLDAAEHPDVLIAGCGSGEAAIEAALAYRDARVLAVDESAADLAYGLRHAQSLNLKMSNLRCADLTKLAADRSQLRCDRSGALTRLPDPLAALNALVSLLRAGGVMRIGLLGEAAHQVLTGARAISPAQGSYQPDPEGVRSCDKICCGSRQTIRP